MLCAILGMESVSEYRTLQKKQVRKDKSNRWEIFLPVRFCPIILFILTSNQKVTIIQNNLKVTI